MGGGFHEPSNLPPGFGLIRDGVREVTASALAALKIAKHDTQSGDSENSVAAVQDASRCRGRWESLPGLGLRQSSGALTTRAG